MHVGFMGLGVMGTAMCSNILAAGHELSVYNRTPEKARDLTALGAHVAASPAELAEATELTVSMVTGPEATDELLFGTDGAAPALRHKTFVSMSSILPAYATELAEKLAAQEADFVDAPVSGSQKPAQEGQLVILAGGTRQTVDGLEPVFSAVGKRTVYCGRAGAGSMMKMAVNLLLGVMMEGLAEMVDFGRKGGLRSEDMLDVVLSGPLNNVLFGMKKEMFLNDEFTPQFALKHMAKDLNFMVQTADGLASAVPAGRTVRERFRMGMEQGLGEEDFAAVFKTLT